MDKREELIAKLGELRREFEWFPEEQKVFDDAVQELTNPPCSIPPIDQQASNADLLRMARHLGKYCNGRVCDNCFLDSLHDSDGNSLSCFCQSWSRSITDDLIREVEQAESENEEEK